MYHIDKKCEKNSLSHFTLLVLASVDVKKRLFKTNYFSKNLKYLEKKSPLDTTQQFKPASKHNNHFPLCKRYFGKKATKDADRGPLKILVS